MRHAGSAPQRSPAGLTQREEPDLLDSDLVEDWSRSTAARWLPDRPASEPDDAAPAVVRARAQATIIETAAVMGMAAQRAAGDCSTNAPQIAEWLRECLDAVAAADEQTDPQHRIETLGSRAGDRSERRRRQWNAALRENIQRAGVGWVRGRDDGPIEFTVARLGRLWTVVEHGYAATETELSKGLIGAVATATTRHALAAGRRPAARETVVEQLRRNVDDYCRGERAGAAAQEPDRKRR